jgi:hypothetical protein
MIRFCRFYGSQARALSRIARDSQINSRTDLRRAAHNVIAGRHWMLPLRVGMR